MLLVLPDTFQTLRGVYPELAIIPLILEQGQHSGSWSYPCSMGFFVLTEDWRYRDPFMYLVAPGSLTA